MGVCAGLFITEITMVLALIVWIYMRLWIFPTVLLPCAYFESGAHHTWYTTTPRAMRRGTECLWTARQHVASLVSETLVPRWAHVQGRCASRRRRRTTACCCEARSLSCKSCTCSAGVRAARDIQAHLPGIHATTWCWRSPSNKPRKVFHALAIELLFLVSLASCMNFITSQNPAYSFMTLEPAYS